MELRIGSAGWVEVVGVSTTGRIFVRLAKQRSGRWSIHELALKNASGEPLRGADLRTLPLSKIESKANESTSKLESRIDRGSGETDFERMFSLNRKFTEVGNRRRIVDYGFEGDAFIVHTTTETDLPHIGTRNVRLTDEFLQQVALAYRAAVAAGQPPAPTLQKQAGIASVRTVHGWIRKAQQLGFLPPPQRGRAG